MKLFRKKEVRSRTVVRQVPPGFRLQIIKGVVRLTLTALLFSGLYYVTHRPAFTLTTVQVSGGETIPHDEVRARALDALAGSYLLIVPKRFTYTYPEENVLEAIQKIPRIHNVQLVRTSRNELSVTFDEYLPYALWCAQEENENPCFFLSEEGYAFAPAPDLQGGALLRHYTEAYPKVEEGQVIDTENLARLTALIERIEAELGFRVASLVHKNNKDIELHVNGGGLILIASAKDVDVTFDNLKTVLTSDTYSHIEPGNFQYVDVRFDNKVFVNETTTPIASTTEDVLLATEPEDAGADVPALAKIPEEESDEDSTATLMMSAPASSDTATSTLPE